MTSSSHMLNPFFLRFSASLAVRMTALLPSLIHRRVCHTRQVLFEVATLFDVAWQIVEKPDLLPPGNISANRFVRSS